MGGARRLDDEVRVGLEERFEVVAGGVSGRGALPSSTLGAAPKDPLDELWFNKPIRQHVREFGAIFGVLFLILASVALYRGKAVSVWGTWAALGIFVPALGYLAPNVLRPVWRGWMKLAHYLSIVMTGVILVVTWVFGFMLISAIMRLCGVKRMDRSFKSGATTYWVTRDTRADDFKRLELQY